MLTIMTLQIIADKDWLECDSTAIIACYHPLYINHLGSYMQNCLSFYALSGYHFQMLSFFQREEALLGTL